MCKGTQQAVCCQLAHCKYSKAFGILCADCEFVVWYMCATHRKELGLSSMKSSSIGSATWYLESSVLRAHCILARLAGELVFPWCSRDKCQASFADYKVIVRLFKAALSPLVTLATRRNEPDFDGTKQRDTNKRNASTGGWRF